jgi:hypothetical protein
MKKSTCKWLIGIGVFWILMASTIIFLPMPCSRGECEGGMTVLEATIIDLFVLNLPGVVAIIVGLAKWNSAEEMNFRDRAKIQAMRKAKVKVRLKGKV